ncbi:MAG: glycosyltransferase family 2 protein [Clostridia bacterium]|nr:glycosyltransferase family 2 protein [Clostridia bacterium]
MDLISVIIPVYNVEKYLNRCIQSVINQTYENLEIILINDGSVDKSPKICNKYAKKDIRIKVIHKKNEGVSVARNVGMENATGTYLCFVDSDDFLPMRSIEYLYKGIVKGKTDLSLGCWTRITPKGAYYKSRKPVVISKLDREAFMDILNVPEIKGPVAKLFKTEIIKTNKLLFPKDIVISEDTIFVYQYTQYCSSISVLDQNVYYYNKLSLNSVTTTYYERFHEIAFVCVKEYVKNVTDCEQDLHSLKLQQKIVGDFFAVKEYLLYFQKKKVSIAEEKLKQTYEYFKSYIKMDTILNYKEQFEKYLTIYPLLEAGKFKEALLFNSKQPIRDRQPNKIKYIILHLWIKIKVAWIFGLNRGYKD